MLQKTDKGFSFTGVLWWYEMCVATERLMTIWYGVQVDKCLEANNDTLFWVC
jgi:hypothetical protein